jgi:hypothetical protein
MATKWNTYLLWQWINQVTALKCLSSKGQLISKCPFNLTTMIPQVELYSFVFWKILKTPKRQFEINWPLSARIIGPKLVLKLIPETHIINPFWPVNVFCPNFLTIWLSAHYKVWIIRLIVVTFCSKYNKKIARFASCQPCKRLRDSGRTCHTSSRV